MHRHHTCDYLALARYLAVYYQVLLWGVWLAGLLVVGRLFGPVLFYDLVRSARRLRFVVVRTLYALFIAFILCNWLAGRRAARMVLSGIGLGRYVAGPKRGEDYPGGEDHG